MASTKECREPLLDRRTFIAGLGIAMIPGIATGGHIQTLKRGINIHHLLNWPRASSEGDHLTYDWPAFDEPNHQMSAHEIEFVCRNFDFIRLTIDTGILMDTEGARRDELLTHIATWIKRFTALQISVIADLHPVSQNSKFQPSLLVQDPNSALFARYVDVAGAVASALAQFREGVILELMNEPLLMSLSQASQWQGMLEQLHKAARNSAPKLPLMLTGLQSSSINGLALVDVAPFRDSDVYFTFHYYSPYAFTHQGYEHGPTRYVRNIDWPSDRNDISTLSKKARVEMQSMNGAQGPSGEEEDEVVRLLATTGGAGRDANQIARDFARASRWARDNGIAPERIVVGEFGCVSAAPLPARTAWIQTVREAAEMAGFPWCYWALKGYGGMGLVDEKAAETGSPIMRALGV